MKSLGSKQDMAIWAQSIKDTAILVKKISKLNILNVKVGVVAIVPGKSSYMH